MPSTCLIIGLLSQYKRNPMPKIFKGISNLKDLLLNELVNRTVINSAIVVEPTSGIESHFMVDTKIHP